MTEDEAKDFITRLECAFPFVAEHARFNSPDMGKTHRTWARVLAKCSLKECDSILDAWIDGQAPAPSREDQKVIAYVIRSMIGLRRDRERKRQEQASVPRHKSRGSLAAGIVGTLEAAGGSEMVEATDELKPHHRRLLKGEISEEDYEIIKSEVIERRL